MRAKKTVAVLAVGAVLGFGGVRWRIMITGRRLRIAQGGVGPGDPTGYDINDL
jgi:hypothetical protein